MYSETARAEFAIGSITVGTSATQLAYPKLFASKSYVLVQAGSQNTNNVYVGNSSTVTSGTGWELGAGESVKIPIDDPSKVWVIGGAAGQSVKWLAV